MKYMIAAASVACALTCANASATTFDLSYSFTNGGLLTGSLDGTLVGTSIEDVSNVQLAFNGLAYDQPLFAGVLSASDTLTFGNPIISTVGADNDFVIGNAESTSATEFFLFIGSVAGGGASEVEAQGPLGSQIDVPMNSSWTITPAPVPLPAAGWLLSSGIGLLGVWRQRKTGRPSPCAV
jgi:hypothetical protein